MVSTAECNDLFFACIHEVHVFQTGFLLGLLVWWLGRKSPYASAAVLGVAFPVVTVYPIHGITKPWYFLGGVVLAVGLASAMTQTATYARERL